MEADDGGGGGSGQVKKSFDQKTVKGPTSPIYEIVLKC